MIFEAISEFLSWLVFELIWTPLFYGPGWLVCRLTPFWRDEARALLREPIWDEPHPERSSPFFSDPANAVAFIGFCATLVLGGAAYGVYLLRG